MKRLLAYICSIVFALPLMAQAEEAEAILDRTAEAYRKAGGIEINFTARAAGTVPQSGVLRLKGEKFLLELFDGKTWFNGHTQWTYVEATNEVTITEPTPEELKDINPYAWLTLHKRGYKATLVSDATEKDVYKILLTPKERKQGETQLCMTLCIKRGSYTLARVVSDFAGEPPTLEITVDSYKTNQPYDDSTFEFTKSYVPSSEFIDLR